MAIEFAFSADQDIDFLSILTEHASNLWQLEINCTHSIDLDDFVTHLYAGFLSR